MRIDHQSSRHAGSGIAPDNGEGVESAGGKSLQGIGVHRFFGADAELVEKQALDLRFGHGEASFNGIWPAFAAGMIPPGGRFSIWDDGNRSEVVVIECAIVKIWSFPLSTHSGRGKGGGGISITGTRSGVLEEDPLTPTVPEYVERGK